MDSTQLPAELGGSAVRLRGLLGRLRWAPWVVVAAASSVVVAFYVLAAQGTLGIEAAHQLTGVVVVVTSFTVLAIQWGLRSVSLSILALLDEVERSRQQADRGLQLRRDVASILARLQQARQPAELAQILLSALAERLRAHQSLCCLWDEKQSQLVTAARYGGEGDSVEEVMTRRPHLGNLIGECARQREVLVLREPGPDYVKVNSGLGEMAPAAIVLYPIQHGGRLFAVLELATVEPFDDDGLELLRELEPVFAMNLDILQRAQRTEDLLTDARAAQENNRLILSSVGEGIWGVDQDGYTTFVNQAALQMLGYEEAEVLGKHMHDLVHHHHMDGTPYPEGDCPMSHTLFDGERREVLQDVLWRQDGTPVSVEYVTTAIHQAERVVGAVVVFREAHP